MRPAVRHVVTCLPCGHREAVRPGNSYPPRCPNCGSPVELRTVAIDTLAELRDIPREGSRRRVPRPRVVLMRAP